MPAGLRTPKRPTSQADPRETPALGVVLNQERRTCSILHVRRDGIQLCVQMSC